MNREIVTGSAGLYPLTGDVQSTPGNSLVTVVGLQSIPILDIPPNNGSLLQYNAGANQWQPTQPMSGNASMQVNGVAVSDDYVMTVNVTRPIKINGA